MKVLFVSPEVHPLVKTGGLGDVSGALPKALKKLKVDVRVATPRYKQVSGEFEKVVELHVPLGVSDEDLAVYRTDIGTVPVYLIESPKFFDRPNLYGHEDDCQRFAFFCKAVLEMLVNLNWRPNIIHCNDWQSGLIPAYLKTVYSSDEMFKGIKTVFTIHNLQYQGNFEASVLKYTSLPKEVFTMHRMEFHGMLSYIKGGIVYADAVNTVSPQYAKEIQAQEYGCGLDGLLRAHNYKLHGILNGIDYETWNPKTDRYLPANYDSSSLENKKENKRRLCQELGLEEERPLVGTISRLSAQKGWDILIPVISELLEKCSFVVLGTGDEYYQQLLKETTERFRKNCSVHIKFDERLAHLIYAASDIFLMPSRYEPCGLGQMISLRYGTIPVVRRTGGLADTVRDGEEKGTGFVFDEYHEFTLLKAALRAIEHFRNKPAWRKMQIRGMRTDFSWKRSANEYLRLYQSL